MKKDVKNEIITATINLINEKGIDTESITIRDISDHAGIGVGLVNYHFQTKENLIGQCVQKMIGDVISKARVVHESVSNQKPEEQLRYMMKYTCAYLEAHENMSRISIITGLTNSSKNDNTSQTASAFFRLMRKVYSIDIDDKEVWRQTYLLIFTVQMAFLRSKNLVEDIGFDFHDRQQRDMLVDKIINRYLPDNIE